MAKFDSFIFDMDGTLWDAVDSYARIWNAAIDELGIDVPHITRAQLAALMGTPIEGIFDALIGTHADRDRFTARLHADSSAMMPRLGGTLYPEVTPTLAELSRNARLFMVSNCEKDTLPVFLDFTGLRHYMTDALSFGATGAEKDVNIRTLIEKYSLKAPAYVGDTMGDLRATHAAGIPFIWARYGFGKDVTGQDYTIDSIKSLLDIQNGTEL